MQKCPTTRVVPLVGRWLRCELADGHDGAHRAELNRRPISWPDRETGSVRTVDRRSGWVVTDEEGGRHWFAGWEAAADDLRRRVWNWAETQDGFSFIDTGRRGHAADGLERRRFGVGWTPETPQRFISSGTDGDTVITLTRPN